MPSRIHALLGDDTRRRRTERALAVARERLRRQLHQSAADRTVAVKVASAILPTRDEPFTMPGLRACVRYLPAEQASGIGGDWYLAAGMPDGRAILAIGDVAGHGQDAIAGMARLRGALDGLAITGADASQLVAWLNALVCHQGDAEATDIASAVVAHFDPGTRLLAWASAGHPPPVLLRGVEARLLTTGPVPDPVLGAVPNARYRLSRRHLKAGDLIMFYSDGLIERRDSDLSARLDLLLTTVATCAGAPPEEVVDEVLVATGHGYPQDDTCVLAVRVS